MGQTHLKQSTKLQYQFDSTGTDANFILFFWPDIFHCVFFWNACHLSVKFPNKKSYDVGYNVCIVRLA